MNNHLNHFSTASAVIIAAFIITACDPSSTTEFRIENKTDSEITITCYGFVGVSTSHEREKITKTLAIGEAYKLDQFERLTSTPVPYRRDVIEFFDSVKAEHKSRQIVTGKTFRRTVEWPFNESEGVHLLTIDEGDF